MKEDLNVDSEAMFKLMRYAFLRLDGAWFMAAAKKIGIEEATDLDVKAWEMFSERLGKKIVSTVKFEGGFIQVIPKVMKIQDKLYNLKTEFEIRGDDTLIHRVVDCEIWKMVSKVWTKETFPCHKVTQASIRGLLKGAFPGKEFEINFIKKIPLGDPCCEVEISLKNA